MSHPRRPNSLVKPALAGVPTSATQRAGNGSCPHCVALTRTVIALRVQLRALHKYRKSLKSQKRPTTKLSKSFVDWADANLNRQYDLYAPQQGPQLNQVPEAQAAAARFVFPV